MESYDLYEKKYNYYKGLLSLSYSDAVQSLIEKHGEVVDNYYKEKSYNKFLNGEIKRIAYGKYTKTKEGLYCHHIMENEYENISNNEYIAHYKYPYEYHHKENLVYCDLIEHLILHALITEETNGDRGFKGLVEFLIPTAEEWYIDGYEPRVLWMQLCRERAFLSEEYTEKLLSDVDELLKDVEVYQELLEEIREEELRKLEREERLQEMIEQRELEHEERIQRHMQNLNISREEYENNVDLIKEEAHRYINKDSIFELRISKKTPRKEVLELLQHYEELYDSSKFYSDEYASSKLNTVRDDLIEELRELSKKVELKLENAKYYKKDGNYNFKVRRGLSFEVTPESANIIIDGKRLQ
ncbi:hypothetical protein I6J04_13290 (plasmid) [Staphylococcus carnosus]|uniref:hypothetical protein n=1 Tax=Staphylococcus carnosus TaxID=1281 RepID=UPI001918F376|nr:hypothetical protein [Staphylococcus carnosus]QQS86520.1 hypothetical protein I6J04_13290 [Staphylococcus carnosus]